MQSNQIIIINGTLRVIGAFLLLSRRAHLLTTDKTRRVLFSGGISTTVETVRSPRVAAPLEPYGSCRRAVTFRAVACPTTAFSFYKKETKILPERCFLKECQSII